ncbi:hypothetical protein CMI48_03235 [Candidatus Pacearchaeota archaeon]|nr:hypothetical protein [Candidatus Pacearchaeota archaeon]
MGVDVTALEEGDALFQSLSGDVVTLQALFLAARDAVKGQFGVGLPHQLLLELHAFVRRNRVVDLGDEFTIEHCCKRCLKAYLLERAEGYGVSGEQLSFLESYFSCEAGHDGWYLDGDDLLNLGASLHSS